jgi:hypothetical protein
MNIKIFIETRKNHLIFKLGKMLCKIFGHKKFIERYEIINGKKEIKEYFCPRCFKIKRWWYEH